jgi:hypothetical protein
VSTWPSKFSCNANLGGPRTAAEPSSRTAETKPPQENDPNTAILQAQIAIFEELNGIFFSRALPIPRINRHRGRHRSQFVPPQAPSENSQDHGEIRIDDRLIWTSPADLLRAQLEAMIELELHCLGDKYKYSEGYRHSHPFLLRAHSFGIAAVRPGTTGKATREDFELRTVEGSRAEAAFRHIIASDAFARLRAAIPDPRKTPEPVSERTGKTKRQTKNDSKTPITCARYGLGHIRLWGKPGSECICGKCYKQTGEIVFLVADPRPKADGDQGASG